MIHRTGYLNRTTPEGTIKLNDIIGHVKYLYEKDVHKDYQLYVTGHSLGAALAAYLAYTLAGRNDIMDIIPGPVTAITFAAPQMANPNCNNAFEVRIVLCDVVSRCVLEWIQKFFATQHCWLLFNVPWSHTLTHHHHHHPALPLLTLALLHLLLLLLLLFL